MIDCEDVVKYYAETEKTELFVLLQSKWIILKEIAYILSIPYDAIISLQKKSLTISDVFGIWMKMQLHLNACLKKSNYQTGLANHLLNAINNRKDQIFETPIMAAALFLDPRYRHQILKDDAKVSQAKTTLKNIWRKLLSLSANDPSEEGKEPTEPINSSNKSDEISFEYDKEAELDKYLTCTDEAAAAIESITFSNEVDIEHILDTFNPAPITSKENILEWWEANKNENHELYKLASVVFAIPPTEVQIERDFSSLNFVFSNRRCNLTEEMLEYIMVIHLNEEVFHFVKQQQQYELLSAIE